MQMTFLLMKLHFAGKQDANIKLRGSFRMETFYLVQFYNCFFSARTNIFLCYLRCECYVHFHVCSCIHALSFLYVTPVGNMYL